MNRYLAKYIEKDLPRKLVLLTGPRQVGKTWLSRRLCSSQETTYLNYDSVEDRRIIRDQSWKRSSRLVVLDELHKMKNWKGWIKGIYDTEGTPPGLLVTGSAQLDVWRRAGRESLAGRHVLFRLHPLSVAELKQKMDVGQAFERLMTRGGFPEPFLAESDVDADRWRLSHVDRMLRDDLRDLTIVTDIRSLEYLVQRLAEQVGSPISYQSLSEDIGVAATTVKRWIQVLQAMYVVFVVHPWTRKVKRAIQKQPKVYFYDTGRIPRENTAARFENLVATALLKRTHFLEDTKGVRGEVFYLRDKQKHEVDFLVTEGMKPSLMIECKSSKTDTPHFTKFAGLVNEKSAIVLVRDARHDEDRDGYVVRRAAPWLGALEA